MSVEVTFKIRKRDLLDHVEAEFGSLEGLRRYLRDHPDDVPRIVISEALRRHKGGPNSLMTLKRIYIGEYVEGFADSKFAILQQLMQTPDIGLRELARAVGKNVSTVSAHVKELRARGLVSQTAPDHGRRHRLRPIPQEITIKLVKDKARSKV